jgi:transcriptional regulator with XRE-family HTH domain
MGRRRITGAQMAKTLGVSPAWVSYRINGSVSPSVEDLERIADCLGVGIVDLIPRANREVTVTDPHPVDVPATNRIVPPRPPSRRDHSRPGGRSAPTGPRRAPRVPRDIAA